MNKTNDSLLESYGSANVDQKQTPRKPRGSTEGNPGERGIRSLSRITTNQPHMIVKPKKIRDTETSVSELL